VERTVFQRIKRRFKPITVIIPFLRRVLIGGITIGVVVLFQTPTIISPGPEHLLHLMQAIHQKVDPEDFDLGIAYWDPQKNEAIDYRVHDRFNPASVIKVPIMLATLEAIHEGMLKDSETMILNRKDKVWGSGKLIYAPIGSRWSIQDLIRYMIVYSDNTATKMLVDRLTLEGLQVEFNRAGYIGTEIGTGHLLKAQEKNWTTVADMKRVLNQLLEGDHWHPEGRRQAKELMKQNVYRWGIPKYLHPAIPVSNKTGTLKGIVHDMGIIWDGDAPYIIVISVRQKGTSFMVLRERVAEIAKVIYDWRQEQQSIL
jgi:beta-lactamase class A